MKPNKFRFFAALTLALLLGVVAFGQSASEKPCPNNKCRNEVAGIEFTAPAGWSQEVDEHDILDLSAPGGEFSVLVWTTEYGKEAKLVGDKVIDELAKIIKNPQFEKEGESSTHNGMDIVEVNGKGKVEGSELLFDMTAVAAPGRIVFFLSLASPEGFKKHSESYGAFYQSIKKIGK